MRRDPAIWFQQMDVARPLRNRVHLDVGVPSDLAHERVAAVEAAGGREAFAADYYVTLADAEGNEVDVAPLTPESDLADAPETADWRVLFGAMTHYPTATYGQAAELAAAVAELADEAGIGLLVDLRPGGVTIDTGKDRWVDERFGDLARQVQAAARGMGLTADPSPCVSCRSGSTRSTSRQCAPSGAPCSATSSTHALTSPTSTTRGG